MSVKHEQESISTPTDEQSGHIFRHGRGDWIHRRASGAGGSPDLGADRKRVWILISDLGLPRRPACLKKSTGGLAYLLAWIDSDFRIVSFGGAWKHLLLMTMTVS